MQYCCLSSGQVVVHGGVVPHCNCQVVLPSKCCIASEGQAPWLNNITLATYIFVVLLTCVLSLDVHSQYSKVNCWRPLVLGCCYHGGGPHIVIQQTGHNWFGVGHRASNNNLELHVQAQMSRPNLEMCFGSCPQIYSELDPYRSHLAKVWLTLQPCQWSSWQLTFA